MSHSSLSRIFAAGSLCVAALAIAASAQRLDVKVIDRRASETAYNYQVPARPAAASGANTDCNASSSSSSSNSSSSANCSSSDPSTSDNPATIGPTYRVTGVTLALLLPDGKIAVVNCVTKNMLKFDYINHRSCRIPSTNTIQADFSGKSVKLKWPASLDARKLRSETYHLVAFIPQP